MRLGIVGFSFGRVAKGPDICNIRLAGEINRILRETLDKGDDDPVVIVQEEIAIAIIETYGGLDEGPKITPDHVIHQQGKEYLSSSDVMAAAAKILEKEGVNQAIIVANPFLHLVYCKKLAREYLTVIERKINWIGFCRESAQWWTRGPVRLFLYAVGVKLGVKH